MSRIAVSRTFLHACRALSATDRALCFDFVLARQDDATRPERVADSGPDLVRISDGLNGCARVLW